MVGIGSGAVAVTKNALGTQILHGSTSGKLTHGTTVYTAPTTSGSTRSFTIQRTYTNNTAADITINEVGIYVHGTAVGWSLLLDRTLSTKTIPAGTAGTLTYTLGVTV